MSHCDVFRKLQEAKLRNKYLKLFCKKIDITFVSIWFIWWKSGVSEAGKFLHKLSVCPVAVKEDTCLRDCKVYLNPGTRYWWSELQKRQNEKKNRHVSGYTCMMEYKVKSTTNKLKK